MSLAFYIGVAHLFGLVTFSSATAKTAKTFLSDTTYTGANCVSGNEYKVQYWDAWADGECYMDDNDPVKYRKYTCNSTKATRQYFSDNACTVPLTTSDNQVLDTNVCTATGVGNVNSRKLTCSTSTQMQNQKYVTYLIHTDSACTSTNPTEPTNVFINFCRRDEDNDAWDKSDIFELNDAGTILHKYEFSAASQKDCSGAKGYPVANWTLGACNKYDDTMYLKFSYLNEGPAPSPPAPSPTPDSPTPSSSSNSSSPKGDNGAGFLQPTVMATVFGMLISFFF
eukprot:g1517.t1